MPDHTAVGGTIDGNAPHSSPIAEHRSKRGYPAPSPVLSPWLSCHRSPWVPCPNSRDRPGQPTSRPGQTRPDQTRPGQTRPDQTRPHRLRASGRGNGSDQPARGLPALGCLPWVPVLSSRPRAWVAWVAPPLGACPVQPAACLGAARVPGCEGRGARGLALPLGTLPLSSYAALPLGAWVPPLA